MEYPYKFQDQNAGKLKFSQECINLTKNEIKMQYWFLLSTSNNKMENIKLMSVVKKAQKMHSQLSIILKSLLGK